MRIDLRDFRAHLRRQSGRVGGRAHGPDAGKSVADVAIGDKHNSAEVDVREQDSTAPITKLHLQVRDRIGVVEFLEIDNDGRMFVLTENIPNNAKRPAGVFVVRFSPQGVLEGIYDIPLQEDVAISRRFIAITPDGDVYFLRSRKGEVDVVGVGSRRGFRRPSHNVKLEAAQGVAIR